MNINKIFDHIEVSIIALTLFLTPIIILPFFPNIYSTPKLLILTLGIALVFIAKIAKTVLRGTLKFTVNTFDLGIILLAISFIASTVLRTPNKMEALFLPGTTTLTIAGVILYFLINQTSQKAKELFKYSLIGSGVILSIVSLLALANILEAIPQLPEYTKATTFNLIGNSITQGAFLASVLPLSIGVLLGSTEITKKILTGVASTLIFFGLIITIFNSFPGKTTGPRLPDFNTSWIISVESLKTNPIFGVGPGNYLTAFNKWKPLTYNQTDLWAVRFTSARNYPLTAITETGLVGLTAMFIIAGALIKHERKLINNLREQKITLADATSISIQIALLTIISMMLLFPASIPTLVLFFVLLAMSGRTKSTYVGLEELPSTRKGGVNIPTLITVLPVVALVVIYGFYVQKLILAEYTFKKSLDAVAKNDGGETYKLLQSAITKNPSVDRYHASYAQVNLALANAIAQKTDISDQDRQNISQLVQQAIREGKTTVALNPQRANNWEILGNIYRAIIPLAEGADKFAAETYNQAAILDPGNPNTRIALGGLFYRAGNYEGAIDIFSLATRVKSDHANAHYNLAASYRENKQIDEAIKEMSIVLSLVEKGSPDWNAASKELGELQTKRTSALQKGTMNLTTPESIVPTDPSLDPQLELPADSEPPQFEEVVQEISDESTPEPTLNPEELNFEDQPLQ